VVETTAQTVKDGGSDTFRQLVSSAQGGVLFIDEAYDLDPLSDYKGRAIVNEILTVAENERKTLSIILAGYEDEIQNRLYKYNIGLSSRFHEIRFDDFTESELADIWTQMRESMGWKEDEKVTAVVVKRLSKRSGKRGFGNAREVRSLLESSIKVAMTRLDDKFSPTTMILTIQDVIGRDPRIFQNEKLDNIVQEIESKIGWASVKQSIKDLIDLCSVNYQRELLAQPPLDIPLNKLFLGAPGTGKTTCAKLYGKLLKELGFLSSGEVISKTASDFVGAVVGQSQSQTNQILEISKGKVLIIDEAYNLNDGLYGKQVLDTIVEKVQGTATDDIAVLLLGYEKQMIKMLGEQNPGLARRFPKEQAFIFDDYSEKELLQILDYNLMRRQIDVTLEFREKAMDVISIMSKSGNFGNAGAVDQVINGAVALAAKRAGNKEKFILTVEDIGESQNASLLDPISLLDDLRGVDMVRAKLITLKNRLQYSKQEGESIRPVGNFVFRGGPGTLHRFILSVFLLLAFNNHFIVNL
jgi:Cdc6-like AAA superfamily ATPase